MSDNFYCPLPFKHAYIDSTGVSACCQTPRYKVSLDEWVSHPKLLELQQALLENRVLETCKSCVKQEEFQGHSLRTSSNNCLLYTSPSPRDRTRARMPSSA